MSEIKIGDLVMVVKPIGCCGDMKRVGRIFKVGAIYRSNVRCGGCGFISSFLSASVPGETGATGKQLVVSVSRLIKIDPPTLPETIKTKREIPA